MTRFFTNPQSISGGLIALTVEDAGHIRSLRLRPDEFFIVCDGAGTDYVCRLGAADGGSVSEIIETRPSLGEPTVSCDVYIALAKGDRLDYAVQKSVELGARSIYIFPSARCVSVPGNTAKKADRLQRISLETAKQCGRGRIPEVTAMPSFKAAIEQASSTGLPLFLYECEEKLHLKEALESGSLGLGTISIVTGPEGGFEPSEADIAGAKGMVIVSLGARILRCETAPAAALAAVMFHTGNL